MKAWIDRLIDVLYDMMKERKVSKTTLFNKNNRGKYDPRPFRDALLSVKVSDLLYTVGST